MKPGSAWPRYSLTALMVSLWCSAVLAKKCRNAWHPFSRSSVLGTHVNEERRLTLEDAEGVFACQPPFFVDDWQTVEPSTQMSK